MVKHLKLKVWFGFLLLLACAGSLTVHAALSSGTWQEPGTSTEAINGTPPQAEGATVPVYQGSILLTPDIAHQVAFDAMPKNFSVDDAGSAMQVVNPLDTEGDIFAVPPLSWENHQAPIVNLVWADAATPDAPLDPQPVENKTFCAQNMAGRHLVVWPEIETADAETIPALYLLTTTGVPARNTLSLLKQKIAIDVMPAVGNPVRVSADRQDASLQASKAKVGESITLTVTTQGCDGNPIGNAAFVIRRDDAKNRKGEVHNNNPVHVGDTELTTTVTQYHGTTDAQGRATVMVKQPAGPGVKTHLVVSSATYPDLFFTVDVVFTALTSPDSTQAAMYGHMPESVTAALNGSTYTFTRPKLAAETSGTNGSVAVANETWAQFNWNGADNHCEILPDAEQLMAMRDAHSTVASYPGWPLGEYWSSTADQISFYHYATNMESGSVVRESNSSVFLTSCVDRAQPPAHPKITLSPEGPYVAQVGDIIDLIATVVDETTHKPLPYRYLEIFIDPALNRKGEHKDAWDNLRAIIGGDDIRASSPEHYTSVTDAYGQVHLSISHDSGLGVKTPIRIVMKDDEGDSVTLPFDVIFTVITSPDVDGANMYGHMRGVVDAGNLYKRPLLASEASYKTGQQSENNEEWATFDTVAAATSQCGTGQVPNTESLDHLYSEHPGNKMLTEHGWPTNSFSYIATQLSGEQTAHVSLKTGENGFSSGPNYLTCSANEMVATLDVYFEDNPALRVGVAQVGQPVKMNVHSVNALNGLPVANADFTVTMSPGKRRDGLATGFIDPSQDELLFDGVAYGAGEASMTYQGMTDSQGNAVIMLTQPRGVGLLTPLNIAAVDSLINTPASRSVKFTVATSPDTPNANMWGHMSDTITVGNMTFTRPKLAEEVGASRTQNEANESWARLTHAEASGNETAGGCAANRLPRIDQLQALYDANSGGAIHSLQGWPVVRPYWSATVSGVSMWKSLALDTGTGESGSADSFYTACLTHDNPVPASITIEPVDPLLWYDATGIHAVKVKKGDTLQLKVTIKDAAGLPLAQAPFVLNRGDGYTRKGVKHIAGSGDGIVSPMVIDGESLNDIATTIGKVTGSDGSVIINVTRPDTNGTRTMLTAALYENTRVSASIDTIFTVITSPDNDKANMWGHMQASLSAADGKVYRRPLLYSELSSTSNSAQYTEDNESWAAFYGPDSGKTNASSCAVGYYPSVDALDSLYSQYPGRTIKTAQGWPIDRSYWSGTYAQTLSLEKPRNYSVVDLDDGSHRGVGNATSSEMQYQVCAAAPSLQSAKIVLSGAQEKDAATQAIKVKSSESIPLLVTTTDAMGNPAGNTPFMLKRDAGTARKTSYTSWGAVTMQANQSGQMAQTWAKDTILYGVTGADGTLAISLGEANGPGVKNNLTASLYSSPTTNSSLAVIFTVITSPDSDKANMWGHMQETFTAGNGAKFMRPRLRGEGYTESSNTSYISGNNESWLSLKASQVVSSGVGFCGLNQMPLLADLQSLYADHPGGALETDLGIPLTLSGAGSTRWWSADTFLDGQKVQYRYLDLKSGDNGYNTGNEYYGQLCLTTPRSSHVTLDSITLDTGKDAFAVKKGEAMPLTVAVTDAAGNPQANAVVQIARGGSFSRNSSSPDTFIYTYMTLTPVQPAGPAASLNRSGERWYGVTGNDGKLQLTLNQNDSYGYKTPITASLIGDSQTSVSKDAMFAVITSPDSDYAAYWGVMPDTLTVEGVTLHRPMLANEVEGETDTRNVMREIWATVNSRSDGSTFDMSKNCGGVANFPAKGVLETMRSTQIAQASGWPATLPYLSSTLGTYNESYYCYVPLTAGASTLCPTTNRDVSLGFAACIVH